MMKHCIDWDFVGRREGGQWLRGYVPTNRKTGEVIGKSGVTIATGVDLGQRNEYDIRKLAIPEKLKLKLIPYCLHKKDKAVAFLAANPLVLTKLEAEALDEAVKRDIAGLIIRKFDQHSKNVPFRCAPPALQTVLVSMGMNFGAGLWIATPRAWALALDFDLKGLAKFLRETKWLNPELIPRRHKEAELLESAIR